MMLVTWFSGKGGLHDAYGLGFLAKRVFHDACDLAFE
jgi:hypothetical protein